MKRLLLFVIITLMFILSASGKSNIYKFEKEIKNILKKVTPSIVKVIAENGKKYMATGIIVDNSHILSNITITRHPYKKIYIETDKGKQFPVKLIGKDLKSGLILLKYKNIILKPIKQGEGAETGDWVILVGSFYNNLPSVFQGIVSSLSDEELILNAPMPPGGVGGAVLNRDGNLIGVVRGKLGFSLSPTFTFSNGEGNIIIKGKDYKNNSLCYAVPIKKTKYIITQLRKFGKVKRGWLGINISQYNSNGIEISSIIDKSPATKSLLKKGDIITDINDKKISTIVDLQKAVSTIMPGSKIQITIRRNGKKIKFPIIVGEKDSYQREFDKRLDFEKRKKLMIESFIQNKRFPKIDIEKFKINYSGTPRLGIYIKELNKKDAKRFKSKKNYGLLITGVVKNSAADKAGIKKWDILIGTDTKDIKSKNELRNILRSSKPSEKLTFKIYRNGVLQRISVIPNTNFSFNKEILKDSIRDLSLLISDDFNLNKKLLMKKMKEKIRLLESSSNKKDLENLKLEIKHLKAKLMDYYKTEYKKLIAKEMAIRKELEKLKKEEEKRARTATRHK